MFVDIRATAKKAYKIFSKAELAQHKCSKLILETKQVSDIDEYIDAYMDEYGAINVRYIAETSRKDLKKALKDTSDPVVLEKRINGLLASSAYRGALIARTETHAASQYATANTVEILQEQTGTRFVKAWIASTDERTRPSHAAMNPEEYIGFNEMFLVGLPDGGFEEADRPGDPNLSPANLCNCLHPDTVVNYASPEYLTRRAYDGEMIVINTASGHKLTVTPNHPILTRQGWVGAGMLKKGQTVFSTFGSELESFCDLNVKNVKPTVEQVFNSFAEISRGVRISGSRMDFHGEIVDKDVDVVMTSGRLLPRVKFRDPFAELSLPHADHRKGILLADSLLDGRFVKKLFRHIPYRFIGITYKAFSFFTGSLLHSLKHTFASIAGGVAVLLQNIRYYRAIPSSVIRYGFNTHAARKHRYNFISPLSSQDFIFSDKNRARSASFNASLIKMIRQCCYRSAIFIRQLRKGKTRLVFLDEIINIETIFHKGFVYNLNDKKHYYVANGIVNHNCRCIAIYEEEEFVIEQ